MVTRRGGERRRPITGFCGLRDEKDTWISGFRICDRGSRCDRAKGQGTTDYADDADFLASRRVDDRSTGRRGAPAPAAIDWLRLCARLPHASSPSRRSAGSPRLAVDPAGSRPRRPRHPRRRPAPPSPRLRQRRRLTATRWPSSTASRSRARRWMRPWRLRLRSWTKRPTRFGSNSSTISSTTGCLPPRRSGAASPSTP